TQENIAKVIYLDQRIVQEGKLQEQHFLNKFQEKAASDNQSVKFIAQDILENNNTNLAKPLSKGNYLTDFRTNNFRHSLENVVVDHENIPVDAKISESVITAIEVDESFYTDSTEMKSRLAVDNSLDFATDLDDEKNDIKRDTFMEASQQEINRNPELEVSEIRSGEKANGHRVYEQVEKEVDTILSTGKNQLEIELEPESLGKVRLNLELEDGRVSISFNVENSFVKEQLEHNIHQLRNNFLRQGYNVDHIQVETDNYQSAYRQGDNPQQNQDNPFYQQDQQNPQYDGMTAEEIYQMFLADEETYRYYPSQILNYKYLYHSLGMNYLV
ncbi:MAG: flagellar hook-length control protein FliK, partial [Halanaerobiales bacterium]